MICKISLPALFVYILSSLLGLALCCASLAPAATAQQAPDPIPAGTQLVILSNVQGTLRIDGVDSGDVQPDIPRRISVQPEQHIVEVFAGDQRYRETITVARGASQVVNVHFQTYDWRNWPESFVDDTGIEFVLIKPGAFEMGSNDLGPDEKPAHEVTIREPFYLGKTEVTQAQWTAVMGSNPSTTKGDILPVETISWNDVQRFLKKINDLESCAGCYRLPTEAEWEYAARAGTATAYSFGDKVDDLHLYGWYAGNSDAKVHPVGQKLPNPWGLYDMHGNVWEWVQDPHAPYGAPATKDGPTSTMASSRILRGGGWSSYATNLRSANRNQDAPAFRSKNVGFRLVRPLP